MTVVGLIAEYNPFHNGHKYHIEKIKELYPDALLILVLNGYFLERGEISLLSKKDKTAIALAHGVDIVVELPTLFGTQAADIFALKSIEILQSLGVQKIVFGSESNQVDKLKKIASQELDPSFTLKKEQKNLSYPALLAHSLQIDEPISPNDLLGISYIKAILKMKAPIEAVSIKRTTDYHDTTSCNAVVSASNIRHKLRENQDISKYLPAVALQKITPYNEELFWNILKYKIITDSHLEEYIDVVEGLEFKLKKEIYHASSLDEFILKLKSKRYTYNRIKRMLMHIFLGHLKKDALLPIDAIHILGFSSKGQNYLHEEKKNFTLPLKRIQQSPIYQYEKQAAFLYDLLTKANSLAFEMENKPLFYPTVCSNESNQK